MLRESLAVTCCRVKNLQIMDLTSTFGLLGFKSAHAAQIEVRISNKNIEGRFLMDAKPN